MLLFSQPNVTEYIPNSVTNTPYHTAGSSSDFDAFDHILEVTTNQEAVYAFYWMDENNKVSLSNLVLIACTKATSPSSGKSD